MSAKGKSKKFRTFADEAGKLVKTRFGKKLADYQAVEVWPQAVGPDIASRTIAKGIKSGILLILVETKVWLTQLTILKKELIRKVNEKLGEEVVKDIRFFEKIDKISGRKR